MNAVKQVGKLFNLSSSLPQRPKVSFTTQEIIDDIEVFSTNEEYRNKLYICINEKPPQQEHKFAKIEEFLKGTHDMEEASNTLQELSEKACMLQEELAESVEGIKKVVDECFKLKGTVETL